MFAYAPHGIVVDLSDVRPDYHPDLAAAYRPVPPDIAAQVAVGWQVSEYGFTPPAGAAEPARTPLVPVSVSSAQAKIALSRAGYLPAVKHVIDALGDAEAEIWFSDARVWERNNPRVAAIGAAIGLTRAKDIDDLFRAAAMIAA